MTNSIDNEQNFDENNSPKLFFLMYNTVHTSIYTLEEPPIYLVISYNKHGMLILPPPQPHYFAMGTEDLFLPESPLGIKTKVKGTYWSDDS